MTKAKQRSLPTPRSGKIHKERMETVNVKMTREMIEAIDREAKREDRNRGNMLRVLLQRALAGRAGDNHNAA